MNTRKLARPEDFRQAAEVIASDLRAQDRCAAETAMASFAPPTQALVIRTAFVSAVQPRPGESEADAFLRAGHEAEALLDTVPTASAGDVVKALDDRVVGAMLSANAGESFSTAAHLINPKRIEDLLAGDLELWTEEQTDAAGVKQRCPSVNAGHLIRTLWTIFQSSDDRAHALLKNLNPELVAYPLAIAFSELDLGEEHPADEGPGSLGLRDTELTQLLEAIYKLTPESYHDIVRRAHEMDVEAMREQLMGDAAERVSGEEEAVASARDDEMFVPLDPSLDPSKNGAVG